MPKARALASRSSGVTTRLTATPESEYSATPMPGIVGALGEVGVIEVDCEVLCTPDDDQRLVVYSARPGTEAHNQLRLLRVIGLQEHESAGFSLDAVLLPLWGVGLVSHAVYPPRGLSRAFAPLLCLLSVGYLARYARFLPVIPDFVSYASLASWSCLVGCAVMVLSTTQTITDTPVLAVDAAPRTLFQAVRDRVLWKDP